MNWRRVDQYHLQSDPPGFRIAAYYNDLAMHKSYILWKTVSPDAFYKTPKMIEIRNSIMKKDKESQVKAIAELQQIASAGSQDKPT